MNEKWIPANWNTVNSIHAGSSTRCFGYSKTPYDQGNLALHVNDEPDIVMQNRELLANCLDLPSQPFWLEQTHSGHVIHLQGSQNNNNQADASYTREGGQVLAILTADCLPILLCTENGKEIAAIHAGWRGLAKKIIPNTLSLFKAPKEQILVWIGPAISQACYEVGNEVREQMLDSIPTGQHCFSESKPGHCYMDLAKLAEIQLESLGITQIFQSNLCTFKDSKRFYSYRRDGLTGRITSLIWIA